MSDKQQSSIPSPQSANYSSAVARRYELAGRSLFAGNPDHAPVRSRAESRMPTHDSRPGKPKLRPPWNALEITDRPGVEHNGVDIGFAANCRRVAQCGRDLL